MEIIPVTTAIQIHEVEKLAWEILPEHYGPYIPMHHIIFYLKKYQTTEKIGEQIQNGFEYYLLKQNSQNAAYLALQTAGDLMTLSKLYMLKEYRCAGIGAKAMAFTESRAATLKVKRIELIVNRQNHRAIKFYENHGFKITEPLIYKFENGQSVEDYKMMKTLYIFRLFQTFAFGLIPLF